MPHTTYPRKFPPEVVRTILELLEETCGRLRIGYGLVGKDWFRRWVYLSWNVVLDVNRILSAITQGEPYREPTEDNWARFETIYAPRVDQLVLSYRCQSREARRLAELLMSRYPHTKDLFPPDPSKKRMERQIFPNLTSISLDRLSYVSKFSTADYLLRITFLISHPNVVEFTIRDSERQLRKHQIALHYRIRGISCYGAYGEGVAELHVGEFVITGPSRLKTSMSALGWAFARTNARCLALPHLAHASKEIRRVYPLTREIIFSHTVRPCEEVPHLPVWHMPFWLLRNLDMVISLQDAVELFRAIFQDGIDIDDAETEGSQLRTIRFVIRDNTRDVSLLNTLFELISLCAPSVEQLRITILPSRFQPLSQFFHPMGFYWDETMPRCPYAVGYETLTSIRGCSRLRIFEFKDMYPPMITNEEVCLLLDDLPRINHFVLRHSSPVALAYWRKIGHPSREHPNSVDLDIVEDLEAYETLALWAFWVSVDRVVVDCMMKDPESRFETVVVPIEEGLEDEKGFHFRLFGGARRPRTVTSTEGENTSQVVSRTLPEH